ncbi:MAG: biotin/lipoyl-binding protein, partial [Candidatus Eisenbacteria bacterium]|nr:biotin/lipoyl-binding protein [Candidatus Eisenbacteria bacterium]
MTPRLPQHVHAQRPTAPAELPATVRMPGSVGSRWETRRIGRAPFWIVLVAACVALSSGCGKDHEGGAQAGNRPQGPGAGHPQGPGGGPPTPAVAVAVEQPLKGPIQTYYRTTASLDASNEAAVTARVSGVVTALQCEEGDQVGKDQVLLRIDPTAYD